MEPSVRFELTTCCLQGRLGPCRLVSFRSLQSAEQRLLASYAYVAPSPDRLKRSGLIHS